MVDQKTLECRWLAAGRVPTGGRTSQPFLQLRAPLKLPDMLEKLQQSVLQQAVPESLVQELLWDDRRR